MKPLFWTGYSNQDRIHAISSIEQSIGAYGYITDYKQFSDISISILIELEEQRIEGLHKALLEKISLDDCEIPLSSSSIERMVYLNITFSQATGNIRVEVPAVPG
jgi:hypothetical protein